MPLLKKEFIEIKNLELISFDNIKLDENKNNYKTVHFFLDDYKFENLYSNYEWNVKKLVNYKYIITPDFSVYPNMPLPVQIFNIFKSRYCGAYWQSLGFNVIPSVTWSDERSFKFCFLGIPKNSCVAISTVGNRNKKDINAFMLGYTEMISQIEPEIIICYGKPINRMYDSSGTIIHCPYRKIPKKYKEAV